MTAHGCVTPVPTRYGGRRYRSMYEADVAEALDEAGIEYEYEPSRIYFGGEDERSYLPDFVLSNGVHVEAKGWFKKENRDTILFLKRHRPDLDIRIAFQNPNQKLKPLKSTASQWCDRNRIPWCKGPGIPSEWAEERDFRLTEAREAVPSTNPTHDALTGLYESQNGEKPTIH